MTQIIMKDFDCDKTTFYFIFSAVLRLCGKKIKNCDRGGKRGGVMHIVFSLISIFNNWEYFICVKFLV